MTIKNIIRKICPCFGDNKAPSREIEMTRIRARASVRPQSSTQRQQPTGQQATSTVLPTLPNAQQSQPQAQSFPDNLPAREPEIQPASERPSTSRQEQPMLPSTQQTQSSSESSMSSAHHQCVSINSWPNSSSSSETSPAGSITLTLPTQMLQPQATRPVLPNAQQTQSSSGSTMLPMPPQPR